MSKLTSEQVANLPWYGQEGLALVHTETLSMPYAADRSNRQWLLDIKKKLDDQPAHPLCNKLELVERPV